MKIKGNSCSTCVLLLLNGMQLTSNDMNDGKRINFPIQNVGEKTICGQTNNSKSIVMNLKLQPEPTIAGFNADGVICR